MKKGEIVSDADIKSEIANRHPYQKWLENTQLILEDLNAGGTACLAQRCVPARPPAGLWLYSGRHQDPDVSDGNHRSGSDWLDGYRHADFGDVDKSKMLYTYFKQNFAQVTNPPIDPIREELVMSLVSFIGPRPNIFDLVGSSRRKRLEVRQPILTNGDLEKIRSIGHTEDRFDTKTIDITYAVRAAPRACPDMLDRLCDRAESAVPGGYNIIVLSDRQVGPDRIAIPALLATAAVHHHLIRKGLRTSVGLVVESGEPREVHHFCCLAGYGAEAINPYLAFDTLIDMHKQGEFPKEVSEDEVVYRYIKAVGKGILKVMSKMGISTYQSYCGAQIFDAVGLSSEFVDKFFFGTATTIEGVGLAEIARETYEPSHGRLRPRSGSGDNARYRRRICLPHARRRPIPGRPDVVADLQHAVRGNARIATRNLPAGEQFDGPDERHSRPVQDQDGRGSWAHADRYFRGRTGRRHRQALCDRCHVLRLDLAARPTRRWPLP